MVLSAIVSFKYSLIMLYKTSECESLGP